MSPWPLERGGIALTTLMTGMLAASLAVLVVAGVTSLGEAAARARSASDAAALAGAGTSPLVGGRGDDPCGAAGVLSAANGATLRSCRIGAARDGPGTVVAVTVTVEPRLRLPGLPARVEGRATAGVRPVTVAQPHRAQPR